MNESWLRDGFSSGRGGVSSALAPEELPEDSFAWGKNVSHRGGKPRTRPPLIERAKLPKGRFQGIDHFSAGGGMFVAQIGGQLYRIKPDGEQFNVLKIPLDFENSPNRPTAWMVETDGSFIVQDGESSAIIYDGATARRSDPDLNEVPIGRMMAYGNGRLWLVLNDHEIAAGNIKDSPAGSELVFTEIGYLTGGGAFYIPTKLSGLAFLPIADTASGKGSLVAFSNTKTGTLRAEISSRDLWQQVPAFVTETLPKIGTLSQRGIVAVNQDLFFRSQSGDLRSLRSARAEIDGAGEAPISRDVSKLFDFESHEMLDQASGIYFDNRLLMTASPFIGPRGQTMFKDLMSLDLSPLHSMKGRNPPVYDGEWDGIDFVSLVKGEFYGKERAFAVCCDPDGNFRLFEFGKTKRDDESMQGISKIKASIETRKFRFGDSSQLKKLEACRIFISNLAGSGTVNVHFRSDDHAQWTAWDSFPFCATMTDVEAGGASQPLRNLAIQFRSAVKLLSIPDDETSPITLQRLNVGNLFQLRISWTGFMTLDKVIVYASGLKESDYANRVDLPAECVAMETASNEVVYNIMQPGIDFYVDHDAVNYADNTTANYV
jgi:hypothetical protein